jgi:hypothetical protein
MVFDAAHRQAVQYHLTRELSVASALLRIANETPTSPMNEYLQQRLRDVGIGVRHLKDVPSGQWSIEAVFGVLPDSIEPEVRKIIMKISPPPVEPVTSFLDGIRNLVDNPA